MKSATASAGRGFGAFEESEVVGSLFDGAGKEAEDGYDPDGVAAEEQVAGTGRHGGEEEGERERS